MSHIYNSKMTTTDQPQGAKSPVMLQMESERLDIARKHRNGKSGASVLIGKTKIGFFRQDGAVIIRCVHAFALTNINLHYFCTSFLLIYRKY